MYINIYIKFPSSPTFQHKPFVRQAAELNVPIQGGSGALANLAGENELEEDS